MTCDFNEEIANLNEARILRFDPGHLPAASVIRRVSPAKSRRRASEANGPTSSSRYSRPSKTRSIAPDSKQASASNRAHDLATTRKRSPSKSRSATSFLNVSSLLTRNRFICCRRGRLQDPGLRVFCCPSMMHSIEFALDAGIGPSGQLSRAARGLFIRSPTQHWAVAIRRPFLQSRRKALEAGRCS